MTYKVPEVQLHKKEMIYASSGDLDQSSLPQRLDAGRQGLQREAGEAGAAEGGCWCSRERKEGRSRGLGTSDF